MYEVKNSKGSLALISNVDLSQYLFIIPKDDATIEVVFPNHSIIINCSAQDFLNAVENCKKLKEKRGSKSRNTLANLEAEVY